MTDQLLSHYSLKIAELTVIPSTGGVFEITCNEELIFSKKELGRFPNDGEILELLQSRIS